MLWQPHFGNHRLTIAWVKYQTTIGLNSKLADGNHVLMYDCDDFTFDMVHDGLKYAQMHYELPNIYLYQSSLPGHYLALCLDRNSWIDTIHMVTALPCIDKSWLRGGVARQYFTIRIGQKNGQYPKPMMVLKSKRPETVDISELVYYDRYETTG
jgi:hypothetical protein